MSAYNAASAPTGENQSPSGNATGSGAPACLTGPELTHIGPVTSFGAGSVKWPRQRGPPPRSLSASRSRVGPHHKSVVRPAFEERRLPRPAADVLFRSALVADCRSETAVYPRPVTSAEDGTGSLLGAGTGGSSGRCPQAAWHEVRLCSNGIIPARTGSIKRAAGVRPERSNKPHLVPPGEADQTLPPVRPGCAPLSPTTELRSATEATLLREKIPVSIAG